MVDKWGEADEEALERLLIKYIEAERGDKLLRVTIFDEEGRRVGGEELTPGGDGSGGVIEVALEQTTDRQIPLRRGKASMVRLPREPSRDRGAAAIGTVEEIEPIRVEADDEGEKVLKGKVRNIRTGETLSLDESKTGAEEVKSSELKNYLAGLHHLVEDFDPGRNPRYKKAKELLFHIIELFKESISGPSPPSVFSIGYGSEDVGFFGRGKKELLILHRHYIEYIPERWRSVYFLHEITEHLQYTHPEIIEKMENLLDDVHKEWLENHRKKYEDPESPYYNEGYFENNRAHYVIRAFTKQFLTGEDELLTEEIRVLVRGMSRRDLPEVLAIEKASFESPWIEEDFIRGLREGNCMNMVAKCDGRIAGFMIYKLHSEKIEIVNFAVHPAYRRRGVGRHMIRRLMDELSYRRRSIEVIVKKRDLIAQKFFLKLGFHTTTTMSAYSGAINEHSTVMKFGDIVPSGLIGKYYYEGRPEFVPKSAASDEGVIVFKEAYDLKKYNWGAGATNESIKIELPARREGTKEDIFESFRRTYIDEIDKPLGDALKATPKKDRFLLMPNKYGIHGFGIPANGKAPMLAIAKSLQDNDVALFHEVGHAANISTKALLKGLVGTSGYKNIKTARAGFEEYINREGKPHRKLEQMQLHYALRFFQRHSKELQEEDRALDGMIKLMDDAIDTGVSAEELFNRFMERFESFTAANAGDITVHLIREMLTYASHSTGYLPGDTRYYEAKHQEFNRLLKIKLVIMYLNIRKLCHDGMNYISASESWIDESGSDKYSMLKSDFETAKNNLEYLYEKVMTVPEKGPTLYELSKPLDNLFVECESLLRAIETVESASGKDDYSRAVKENIIEYKSMIEKTAKLLKEPLRLKAIDLNKEIKQVCRAYDVDGGWREAGVDWVSDFYDDSAIREFPTYDPGLFSSLFYNFIHNISFHYVLFKDDELMEGATLMTSSKVEGDTIVLTVSDNGKGMPQGACDVAQGETVKQNAFKLEWWRENYPDPGDARKGLGLSLCWDIAEMHGGTIEVDSLTEEEWEEFRINQGRRIYKLEKELKDNLGLRWQVQDTYKERNEEYKRMKKRYEKVLGQEKITLKDVIYIRDEYKHIVQPLLLTGVELDDFGNLRDRLNNFISAAEAGTSDSIKNEQEIQEIASQHKKLITNFHRLAEGKRITRGTTFTIRLPRGGASGLPALAPLDDGARRGRVHPVDSGV
jgi:ribosomal-protein-alanine N-acetyltransferase